jgi:hypothetical protein
MKTTQTNDEETSWVTQKKVIQMQGEQEVYKWHDMT